MRKLNVKKMMKLGMMVMAMMMLAVNNVSASAAEKQNQVEEINSITFKEISELGIDENMEYEVVDSEGNVAVVGIEGVESRERATGRTWRVYYSSVFINAEFYMTVSNNKVTNVYDDSILIISGTYDNDILTKTTTYGKLEFKAEVLQGNVAGKCWLKGTVTGNYDEISVTWRM